MPSKTGPTITADTTVSLSRQTLPSGARGVRAWRWPSVPAVARVLVLIALVFILVYPVYTLVKTSLTADDGGLTLANFSALRDPSLLRAGVNSLWIAGGTMVGSWMVAVPMAWLSARTDLPGRNHLRNIVVLTFASPSFIAALGWLLLLGPNAGVINRWIVETFGIEHSPFNIFSPWGIIFVLTMFLYPMLFLVLNASLENMDPQLEQAAAAQGAGPLRVFRTITMPLAAPAFLGGSFLVFVTASITFGPVAILGTPVGFDTVPTALLKLLSFPPRIQTAAVAAVPVLIVVIVLMLLQGRLIGSRSFTTVGGKHGPRDAVRLGPWRYPAMAFVAVVLVLSLVLPFGMLGVMSVKRAIGLPLSRANFVGLENYFNVFHDEVFVRSMTNSAVLAATAVLIGIAISFLVAWLHHRSPSRFNAGLSFGMYASLAIPGAALGIALIIAYSGPPFTLNGHVLLVIGYVSVTLPLIYTYITAGMAQFAPELEEASRNLGAGWLRTWRRITLPLIAPAVVAAALLNFVLLFRELEISIFLYNGSNSTTATLLYTMSQEALYQRVGALSVVILLINTAIVMAVFTWERLRR